VAYEDERDYEEERANEALLHPEEELGEEGDEPDYWVTLTDFVRVDGGVAVFSGITNDPEALEVVFAVDRSYGVELADALASSDVDINVGIEAWQILSTGSNV
jgi:hypothetical protein